MSEIKSYEEFISYCEMIAEEAKDNPCMNGYRRGIRESVEGSEHVIYEWKAVALLKHLGIEVILDAEEELKYEGFGVYENKTLREWAVAIVTKVMYYTALAKYSTY